MGLEVGFLGDDDGLVESGENLTEKNRREFD